MAGIEARVSTKSRDIEEQPKGVFCYVEDASLNAPPPGPVKGWRHNEQRIMREENETDEALAARAITLVTPFMAKGGIPVFHSIDG